MRLLLFTILFFSFFRASSQNIETSLSEFAKDYGEAKIYLYYDKSSYAAGETVWFKAYLMKGMVPDNESKTLYVDWIMIKVN